jgi:pimeloyl-ACP methyl ester carboxylesterase
LPVTGEVPARQVTDQRVESGITPPVTALSVDSAYLPNSLQSSEDIFCRREEMSGNEGYITTEDGVRLFFRKLGHGPKTIVIPNATYMFDEFRYLAEDHTVIAYDLRNRGRSDEVPEAFKLEAGILNDVDDLEAVRSVDVIGHSYLGMAVVLYAMKYPAHVGRVVQIGAVQPFSTKAYPPHLTGADSMMAEVSAKISELQQEARTMPPG